MTDPKADDIVKEIRDYAESKGKIISPQGD